VMHCDALWCIVMHCGCTVMQCDALWYSVHCDALWCIVMQCDVLWCTVTHCDAVGCTVMPMATVWKGAQLCVTMWRYVTHHNFLAPVQGKYIVHGIQTHACRFNLTFRIHFWHLQGHTIQTSHCFDGFRSYFRLGLAHFELTVGQEMEIYW
jgi:hypothetical protein